MPAPRSFRRRLTWPLVLGGIAVACGTSSDLNVTPAGSGGSGMAPPSAAGGKASFGGFGPVATGGGFGDCRYGAPCSPGTQCSTPGYDCECSASGTYGCLTRDVWGGAPNAGGTNTGGTNTGGTATGGSLSYLCEVVSTLHTQGTACSTAGQSQCLPSGQRCVCARGIWYCDHACPGSQPTPNTACSRGAACTYNNGNTGCACINLLWTCIGVSDCPAAADMHLTGQACDGLTGVACDYPNQTPPLHFASVCLANTDAGSGSTWTTIQSAACPSTQPPYDLSTTCTGPAICSYPSAPSHCACLQTGTPWVCGFGYFFLFPPFAVE